MSTLRPPPRDRTQALPAAPTLEVERLVLAPWRAAYTRFFGHAPRHAEGDAGPRLIFPGDDSPAHAAAIGRVRIYADAVRGHLRALGYGWDASGALNTVPTPLSLRHRLRALGCDDAGFTPEYHRIRGVDMDKSTWIARQCAGMVPIAVGTAGSYRRAAGLHALRWPGAAAWRERLRYHLHGVQHDMTKHALCLHLVPASQVRAIGEQVMHARPGVRGRLSREPLARFFESDLMAYCQAIWRDLPDPAAFAPTFTLASNLRQLHAALARRVAESRRDLLAALRGGPVAPPCFELGRPPRAHATPR